MKSSSSILLLAMATVLATCNVQSTKPNIVFIYIDDMGWKDLGVMGSEYYETPNIDRLADQGMLFTNAYSNAPNCAPSRASLLSGQYTPRHGIYTVHTSARGDARLRKLIPVENTTELDLDVVTLAEVLQEAGYVTAHMGKWHLAGEGHLPTDQGFDVNVAGREFGSPPGYFYPYGAGNQALLDLQMVGHEGEYLTDRLTDEAISFLKANADDTFFLYLWHYAVHTPRRALDDDIGEQHDLAAVQPERTRELHAMLREWRESVNAPVPTEPNPAYDPATARSTSLQAR